MATRELKTTSARPVTARQLHRLAGWAEELADELREYAGRPWDRSATADDHEAGIRENLLAAAIACANMAADVSGNVRRGSGG